MIEKFAEFTAFDENGEDYIIFIYYDTVRMKSRNREIIGKNGPFYETSIGHEVLKIKKGEYWIKELDLVIKSDDPNAF